MVTRPLFSVQTLWESPVSNGYIGQHRRLGSRTRAMSGATVGEGCILEPLTYVGMDAELGLGSHLHARSQVDHNSALVNFVTLNPGAIIAGNIQIGSGSTINMGASISNGVFLGVDTKVGAHSFVNNSFTKRGTKLFGIPARVA